MQPIPRDAAILQRQEVHREVDAGELATRHGQIARLLGAAGELEAHEAAVAALQVGIGATLGLSASDRCLNIMPLFHIHGLIAGVLAPLAAGSQVFCTPGFNALKFFGWMDEAKPTWYTAVPTMHQAIVARAPWGGLGRSGPSLRRLKKQTRSP